MQSGRELEGWETQLLAPLSSSSGLGRRAPTLFVRGNHDGSGSRVATTYLGGGAGAFAFAWGPLFIIAMAFSQSRESGEALLRNALASSAAKEAAFRIVIVHVPPFVEYWEARAWAAGEVRHRLSLSVRARAVGGHG